MNTTFTELYNFQKTYLLKILANIPNEDLYNGQENGVSSLGWVLGHLIVEVEDIIQHLKLDVESLPANWVGSFKGGKDWKNRSLKELPNKNLLMNIFETRYDILINEYLNLSEVVRKTNHPSNLFSRVYSNIDSWFAHHLITHIAVHYGNITAWKQTKKIKVEGF